MNYRLNPGFSPVAGIQWVETQEALEVLEDDNPYCFSPVAGIQWVETLAVPTPVVSVATFQSRCRDSVG